MSRYWVCMNYSRFGCNPCIVKSETDDRPRYCPYNRVGSRDPDFQKVDRVLADRPQVLYQARCTGSPGHPCRNACYTALLMPKPTFGFISIPNKVIRFCPFIADLNATVVPIIPDGNRRNSSPFREVAR